MSSTAASASISVTSLEVGFATVIFLSVVAEVLIATCKVNIRKSWTGKVQGFKTISLRKLSENKTQTLPRYKSYHKSQNHTSYNKDTQICSVAEVRLNVRMNNSERKTPPDMDSKESISKHFLFHLNFIHEFQSWDSYAPMAA